jgi:uncharacterized protein (TIGR03435 family)
MKQRTVAVMTFLIVVLAFVGSLNAQKDAFEVASIKRAPPDETRRGARRQPGGRLEVYNMTLRMLIRVSYESDSLQMPEQFVGGPDWAETDRFNIVAKAEGDLGTRVQAMLQSLLEDRFKLRVHTEMRDADIFALVLSRKDGKVGPELHESTADCYHAPPPAGTPVDPARMCTIRTGVGNWTARGVTMTEFAAAAARTPSVNRAIQDRTGLTGKYDFHLEFVPPVIPGPNGGSAPVPNPAADSGPSVFTAIQEQLGLKLQAAKAPLEFLVVDSAERPTED